MWVEIERILTMYESVDGKMGIRGHMTGSFPHSYRKGNRSRA